MKNLVIYHRADFDGKFCYRILKQKFDQTPVKIDYLGWDYGDPVPNIKPYTTIVMADISIKELMELPNLVWIDHHKTAIEAYMPKFKGTSYCIDGVAACRLTWQYCNGPKFGLPPKSAYGVIPEKGGVRTECSVEEPRAVLLAGRYDVFDQDGEPDADLFQFGLRSQELTDADWNTLLEVNSVQACRLIDKLLLQGKAIQRYKQEMDDAIIAHNGFTLEWEGLCFLACNSGFYNSFLFTKAIQEKHQALLGFKWTGKKYSVSMYAIKGREIDLTPIAKKYGGGGHPGACGFVIDKLPFLP